MYDESPKWLQRNQEQITILSSLQKKLKNMKTQYRQDMKSCKRYLLELSMIINQRREGRLFKKKMTDSCVGCYRIAFLLIMLYCYINFCFPIMIYSTNYFQHVQKFRIIIMFSPVCEYMIPEP